MSPKSTLNLLKKEYKILLGLIILGMSIPSCKKYQDPDPIDDPRLDTSYFCNDLLAVNYNWGFPGTPDNSLCIYPTSGFEGDYRVEDSVYNSGDSLLYADAYTDVRIDALNKSYVSLKNYCPADSLLLLCTRFLQITTDTINQKNYDVCGSDTFKFDGRKHSLDTMYFTIRRDTRDRDDAYHILHFYKQ